MELTLAANATALLRAHEIDIAVVGHQELPHAACSLRPAASVGRPSPASEPTPGPTPASSASPSAFDAFASLPLARAAIHFAVASTNGVGSISFKELHDIYAGKTKNWTDLRRKQPGPIHLYGLGNMSIAHRLITAELLDNTDHYRTDETPFDSFVKLRAALMKDPNGIGYTTGAPKPAPGIKYVEPVIGARPDVPSDDTVSTGEYPLFLSPTLYWEKDDPNPAVAEFANIAGSADTVAFIAATAAGFWPLQPKLLAPPSPPPTLGNALRISTTVRFTGPSPASDRYAAIQLDELACFMLELDVSAGEVRHYVFSEGRDPRGPAEHAKDLADAGTLGAFVAGELRRRGVHPGTIIPSTDAVANGELPPGLRRRVETWIVQCTRGLALTPGTETIRSTGTPCP
ncbi:MAG: hypothetical protein M3N49_16090 [Candidatus Eremiobacteraeota bacterium]|nr:hypothetical protein [Candidatus Eremiobacteraeota bacterium]